MDKKKKSKQHVFDSYCKKILKNEARDYYDYLKIKRNNEVSLNNLSEEELEQIVVIPSYFSVTLISNLLGLSILVDDIDIANALMKLSEDKREIILLYYFLDMNDREIAKQLNAIQQTINYQRNTTLKELKKILEEQENE